MKCIWICETIILSCHMEGWLLLCWNADPMGLTKMFNGYPYLKELIFSKAINILFTYTMVLSNIILTLTDLACWQYFIVSWELFKNSKCKVLFFFSVFQEISLSGVWVKVFMNSCRRVDQKQKKVVLHYNNFIQLVWVVLFCSVSVLWLWYRIALLFRG